jgi:hypothetical protein
MHEYLMESLVKERFERIREFAARQALLRSLKPARQPWRVTLGIALIRAGRWCLRGVPRAVEPRRAA